MYYSEEKGRYIIEGEEESDDDEPPPPPIVVGSQNKSKDTGDQAASKEGNQGGAGATTTKSDDDGGIGSMTAAFGGVVGRGRGRGRGGAASKGKGRAMPRFANSFDPSQITTTEIPETLKQQESSGMPESTQASVMKMPDEQKVSGLPPIEEVNAEPALDKGESAALYETAMDITQYPNPSPSLNDPLQDNAQGIPNLFDNKDLKQSIIVG